MTDSDAWIDDAQNKPTARIGPYEMSNRWLAPDDMRSAQRFVRAEAFLHPFVETADHCGGLSGFSTSLFEQNVRGSVADTCGIRQRRNSAIAVFFEPIRATAANDLFYH